MTTTTLVRGICPHDCPDTCGFITEVRDGEAVSFRGDPEHPVAQGWLCAKVRPYLGHVYHPERLLHPLRRVGPKGSGQWERVSWDEAIGTIATQWKALLAQGQAQAILPYSYSGTLGLVQNTVAAARLWNRLGASRVERSICGAAAEHAVEKTLGGRWGVPYEDVLHARLIVIWGHNPVATAPHFLPWLRRAQHQGCQVIVIDPRKTATAKTADWHLAPLPGSDGSLAMGLAHLLVKEAAHDEAWLEAHTHGWPQFRERLTAFPPDRVAKDTGLQVEEIRELGRRYATLRPGLIRIADGINRNRNGGQTVRAICALPALTGQYGLRGGGLAYSVSGHVVWDREAVHHEHACPPAPRTLNMNRLGAILMGEADPPVASLYVFNANPVASTPNAGRIVAGLRREDLFTIVHDLFMTDTADYADLVLPATSQLEQVDLHKAYGHTNLGYNRAALAPRGECKSNWEVMGLLARALGYEEPWLHQSADQVIDEVLQATAAHNPALRGITLERLQREGHVPLTLPEAPPFAEGTFPTPSGKVELLCPSLEAEGVDPLPGLFHPNHDDGGAPDRDVSQALVLVTGAAHHFVSSTFASQADLCERAGPVFLEIHPQDASRRGIPNGASVQVENGRGAFSARAVVTDGVRPGVVCSPKGRWAKRSGGSNVNWTTSDALGDMVGQSTYHDTRVWVRLAESTF